MHKTRVTKIQDSEEIKKY